MSTGLASVEPDGPLYRLGQQPDPWAWPDWSYAAPDGTFGNRYDDPEASYRVLYASSQRLGAFLETQGGRQWWPSTVRAVLNRVGRY